MSVVAVGLLTSLLWDSIKATVGVAMAVLDISSLDVVRWTVAAVLLAAFVAAYLGGSGWLLTRGFGRCVRDMPPRARRWCARGAFLWALGFTVEFIARGGPASYTPHPTSFAWACGLLAVAWMWVVAGYAARRYVGGTRVAANC